MQTKSPAPRRDDDTAADQDPSSGSSKQVEEAKSLDAKTTYEVIRQEGLRELDRSTSALAWSGLAAGLSMGFSFLFEGLLRAHIPDASWRPLVVKLGYSIGFVIVILGSQQLYTENTLTPIVPLLASWSRERLRNVLRLWAAVLLTNLVGALIFGLVLATLDVVEPETQRAFSDIAHEAMRADFWRTALHAVYAGWLIALLVWMLPAAEGAHLGVIVLMTYLVGLGGFAHVIAGASEAFYAAARGESTWSVALGGYIFPALLGNTVGGLTMVAALNHAQATSGE